jgi:hypothetical protein
MCRIARLLYTVSREMLSGISSESTTPSTEQVLWQQILVVFLDQYLAGVELQTLIGAQVQEPALVAVHPRADAPGT